MWLIQASYFVTAFLFIMGLKRMSSPVTARSGIVWAGAGMLVATLFTFLFPGLGNYEWILPAIILGTALAWISGRRVAMTDMPQMIALYNGFGGGAAAAIAAVELYRGEGMSLTMGLLAVIGGLIGAVSFSGSLIAFGKLQGLIKKSWRFGGQQLLNVLILAAAVVIGALVASGQTHDPLHISLFFVLALDVGVMMAFAQKVIVVPGYGMAVAQAQHKVWELCQLLIDRGVMVRFAIHPVAGRMPGHMNVLLAEAGVPYDLIADLDEINAEFETADVALIIGANDVVNPVARTDKSSPIYGMPILNADKAKNVIVIKRGQGAGFSGIENGLFYLDNTRMLYGDGQAAASQLIQAVKAV